MFKLNRILTGLSISFLFATLLPPTAHARDQVAANDRVKPSTGVCNLYNVSGYMIVDAMGRLVNLREYCDIQDHVQSNGQSPPQSPAQNTQNTQNTETLPQQVNSFWSHFVGIADTEAIAFAQTLDRQDVIAYGATICPFLENGGSMADLRQIQSDTDLPVGFETAVTVAAINTYCPNYRSSIGR